MCRFGCRNFTPYTRNGVDVTIDEIFAKHGQTYFRELEEILIYEIQDQTPKVLCLGGGAVMDPVSQDYCKANKYFAYF